ncbi:hypothetical protein SNE40_005068 [Patella caerulea]|uniref:Uncharacterized protein n=1 Tax=Patella caerulea TaxID=87958 RepID=A0AAN8KB73_PATCE
METLYCPVNVVYVVVGILLLSVPVGCDVQDNKTVGPNSDTVTASATIVNAYYFYKLAGLDMKRMFNEAQNNTQLQNKIVEAVSPLNKTFVEDAIARNNTEVVLDKVCELINNSPLLQSYLTPRDTRQHDCGSTGACMTVSYFLLGMFGVYHIIF